MNVYLNKENFVITPFISYNEDEVKEIIVDDCFNEKISSFPDGWAWQYNEELDDFILVELLNENILRARRCSECFSLIDNKCQLWWNKLTATQLKEISDWYDAWLDVTKTKIVPELPEILKK